MSSQPSSSLLDGLRVGQKIALIEGIVAALLGLLLVISFGSFLRLQSTLNEVRDEGVSNALVAKDMQMQVVQMQQWLTDISATRGQDGLNDGFKQAEGNKIMGEFDRVSTELEPVIKSQVAEAGRDIDAAIARATQGQLTTVIGIAAAMAVLRVRSIA